MDIIISDELRSRLNLESIEACVQKRSLSWLDHIRIKYENAWLSKWRAVEVKNHISSFLKTS